MTTEAAKRSAELMLQPTRPFTTRQSLNLVAMQARASRKASRSISEIAGWKGRRIQAPQSLSAGVLASSLDVDKQVRIVLN